MAIEFTDSVKTQIILAAMVTAGPDANDGMVANHVSRAIDFLSDGSAVLNTFDRAIKRMESVTSQSAVPGEILFVDTETSSNRPVVFVRTQPSKHSPDGVEHLRLDRIDGADGERSRALANELAGLVGHRVLLTKVIVKENEQNIRLCRGVQDRGPGEADIAGLTNKTGWQLIDWSAEARVKMAPKLARLNKYRQGM